MYIVVIVETYYPSVFHFHDKEEAKKFYEEKKTRLGHVVHLAKVEESHFEPQTTSYNYEKGRYFNEEDFLEDIELMDVEWHVYR